jgi:hypothetical protein
MQDSDDSSENTDSSPRKFEEPPVEPEPLEELRRRCEVAKIAVEKFDSLEDHFELNIHFPNGRKKREIHVYDPKCAQRILAFPFERYTLLAAYSAYLDREEGLIEALLRSTQNVGNRAVSRVLDELMQSNADQVDFIQMRLELKAENEAMSASIGPGSDFLSALENFRTSFPIISIMIRGVSTKQHDQAVDLLERIANAILFQIDMKTNVPLSLRKVRSLRRHPNRSQTEGSDIPLRFPRYEYDSAPMELYWYARSAIGLPLLRYLAFYQALEFYFPIYSQSDAQRRLRNILKDPLFDTNKNADIGRLLVEARSNSARGYGDEKSQLVATLLECLSQDDLRKFLLSEEDRKSFLSSKQQPLGIAPLQVDRENEDLRNGVAARIYDIRCKIVHTKSGGDGAIDLLLPFSEEATSLSFDIDLIEYVARRVLIAASRPFHTIHN